MSNDKKVIVKVDKKGVGIEFDPAMIEKYFQNPALWFAEVLTGVATYGKKDLFLAGGQIIQGAIKLDLWGELLYQLNKARKEGKTKSKFYESRTGRINFNELFSYLDKNDTPDEEVFKAMQAIFFASEEIKSEQKDEILAYELIQLAKRMKAIDLLVLMAAYELYLKQKEGIKLGIKTVQDWQIRVSEMIKLPIDMVVDSRIKFSGNQEATYPSLFSVNDNLSDAGVINMGLNASSIALSEFISEGRKILSSQH